MVYSLVLRGTLALLLVARTNYATLSQDADECAGILPGYNLTALARYDFAQLELS